MELRLHLDQLLAVRGKLTIVGRQPDGDSIRFIADKRQTLLKLPHASRLRFAKDGSVQLRMDGIDAPETHFAGQAQPRGHEARQAFLELVGFTHVTYDQAGTVSGSNPRTIDATVLINTLDPYGRPVAYLLRGFDDRIPDGHLFAVGADMLAETVNVAMLESGEAYITMYNSMPLVHRTVLQAAASKAKKAKKGVWAVDRTNSFTLTDLQSIGPASDALLLPKLFRRAVHYVQACEAGFVGSFPAWIKGSSAQAYHSEDDYIIRASGKTEALHTVVHQDSDTITTDIDPLTDVFIEQ